MSKNVAVPAMCVAAASGITQDVTVQYIEPNLPSMTGSGNKAQQTTRGDKINKSMASHFSTALLVDDSTAQCSAVQYSTEYSTICRWVTA